MTTAEPKKKMKEWLSCETKIDMMETVIMPFLGAGKKGPLSIEQYVHVQVGYHSIQQVCLHNLSARWCLFQHWVLALTAQTSRAVSTSRWCTRLRKGVKTTAREEHYEGKRKVIERTPFYNCKTINIFFFAKSSPVQTVQGYKRWRLQRVQLPGQVDSAKNRVLLQCVHCYYPITSMGRGGEEEALTLPHKWLATLYNRS